MKIVRSIKELSEYVRECKSKGVKIGLVPTMGALHSGHLSLIDAAKSDCNVAICSIFINPTQFNNSKDLKDYPVSFEKDKILLENHSCDLLFMPSPEEMYPDGLKSESYDIGGIDISLEGKMRPGHFDGVCTIVHKLVVLTKADKAYFGQKDFQQLSVVKRLVKTLEIPTEIKGCPTVREENGLAKSSRNELLNKKEMQSAGNIYKSMLKAKENYANKSIPEIIEQVKKEISKIESSKIDYVEIVDSLDLKPMNLKDNTHQPLLVVAVFLRDVRLIDNLILNE
jgi:pantoate--beta-alanine ligase